MSSGPLIVSYGGGTNSAAMLVGMREHGERPDVILFADTGGEKPRTYGHLIIMQRWCEQVGFPSITIVRGQQPQQRRDGTLENQMLRLQSIPSRAFGFGQCSKEWKIIPQERWCEEHIGARLEVTATKDFEMIELWDDRCVQVIMNTGIPIRGE